MNTQEIWMLLQANSLALGHPNLTNIRAEITRRLQKINEDLAEKDPAPPRFIPKASHNEPLPRSGEV